MILVTGKEPLISLSVWHLTTYSSHQPTCLFNSDQTPVDCSCGDAALPYVSNRKRERESKRVLDFSRRLVCCASLNANPIDELEQLDEQSMSEYLYPTAVFVEDSNLMERAAPRFGRAAPRYGRAAPRFGRRATPLLISRMNHAGRYHLDDDEDDSKVDFPLETESWSLGKRAAPRFGRSI